VIPSDKPAIIQGRQVGKDHSREFGHWRGKSFARPLIRWYGIIGRFEIVIKQPRLGSRAAADAAIQDPDHPDLLGLPKCQHITRADAVARLGCLGSVDPQVTLSDNPGGKAARFEKPRLP